MFSLLATEGPARSSACHGGPCSQQCLQGRGVACVCSIVDRQVARCIPSLQTVGGSQQQSLNALWCAECCSIVQRTHATSRGGGCRLRRGLDQKAQSLRVVHRRVVDRETAMSGRDGGGVRHVLQDQHRQRCAHA